MCASFVPRTVTVVVVWEWDYVSVCIHNFTNGVTTVDEGPSTHIAIDTCVLLLH